MSDKIETKRTRAPSGMITCKGCQGLFAKDSSVFYNNARYCNNCYEKMLSQKSRKPRKSKKNIEDAAQNTEITTQDVETTTKSTESVAQQNIKTSAQQKPKVSNQVLEAVATTKKKASNGFFICKGCGEEFNSAKKNVYSAKNYCNECYKKIKEEVRKKRKAQGNWYKCSLCQRRVKAVDEPFVTISSRKYCPRCETEARKNAYAYKKIMDFVNEECGDEAKSLYPTVGNQIRRLTNNFEYKCTYAGIYKTLVYVFRTHKDEFKLKFAPTKFFNIVLDNYYNAAKEDEELKKIKQLNAGKEDYRVDKVEVKINEKFIEEERRAFLEKRKMIKLGPRIGLENIDLDETEEEILKEREEMIASFNGNYDEDCFIIGI